MSSSSVSTSVSTSLSSDRGEKDRQNVVIEIHTQFSKVPRSWSSRAPLNEALNTSYIQGKTEMHFAIRGRVEGGLPELGMAQAKHAGKE